MIPATPNPDPQHQGTLEQPAEQWPRLGALVTIADRDGVWSVWSRGTTHDAPRTWSGALQPGEARKWWLVPVDATEAERAERAVLLRDDAFMPWAPDDTGELW